jgi:hypothetical protein
MRAYRHGLELMQELCREPRLYWEEDGAGEWKQRAWDGLMFAGQTHVHIDAEPDHNTDLVKQQTVRDYLSMNPQAMATPKTARVVAKVLGVQEELFQGDNLQDDAAEREYIDFFDRERAPVVDPDLDDHDAHYDRHGVDCHSDKWRDLEDDADWDGALPQLSDWETMYAGQPGAVDDTGMPIPGLDQQMGDQWPPDLEGRIFACWQQILSERYQSPTPEAAQALARVLRFRAHMAAHKRVGQARAAAAAQGQQVMAAPQAPETAAGTMPTPGQPQEQAPAAPVA